MFLSEHPSPSRFCKHSLGTILSLLLLSACSPDNDALPGDDSGNTPPAVLRIEVSASGFTSATTRATDNDTEPLLPYRADDGSSRIIVSPQTAAARWFCSYKAEMYGGTMSAIGLAVNNRYTLAPTLDIGDYTLDKASDNNSIYLFLKRQRYT